MNIDHLASALEARREELGWTQRDLSEQSGVSMTTISAIERRARDHFQTTTLISLDRALGWPIGTSGSLLRGDQPATRPIITSRTLSPTAQALLASIEQLDDDQLRALIARAQQMASHSPETFHCEGILQRLSVEQPNADQTISVGVIDGHDSRWIVTQVTRRACTNDPSPYAANGDHLAVTFQRVG